MKTYLYYTLILFSLAIILSVNTYATCVDSDNGNNPNTFGSVKYFNDENSYCMFNDQCIGTVLKEYYCVDSNIRYIYYNCTAGCNNGKCNGNACIPKTCAQLNKTCGTWSNGCGTNINCPTCGAGKTCNATTGQCQTTNIITGTFCTPGTTQLDCNYCKSDGSQYLQNQSKCTATQTCNTQGICESNINPPSSSNLTCNNYAAPKGSQSADEATGSGSGTSSSPWSLQTALSQGNMAGKTICLMPGTYYGAFQATLSGNSGNPVIIRNYQGKRVIIDDKTNGRPYIFNFAGSYIWLWGIEITSEAPMVLDWMPDGIEFSQGVVDNKIINCIIHDAGGGGLANQQGPIGTEVYGTMLYYNGRSPVTSSNGNGNYGTYTQNTGSEDKTYQDNIIFYNWLYGVHMYTEGAKVDNFLFDNNVMFNNGYFRNYCQGSPRTASTSCGAIGTSFERNFLSGGQISHNLRFTNNYMYYPSSPTGGARETIGYNLPAASPKSFPAASASRPASRAGIPARTPCRRRCRRPGGPC